MTHNERQVLELVQKNGLLRPHELKPLGIPRMTLKRLVDKGHLIHLERGLYALPDLPTSEHHSLAEVAKQVPQGVVCLLSALSFHNLTTQAPFEVWLALPEKARKPTSTTTRLRIVRFSGPALQEGIDTHQIESVPVRITNPARTVADLFKYRNKIGIDVALEALRDCKNAGRCTMDDLWRYAKLRRVHNVIRPYLEAMTV